MSSNILIEQLPPSGWDNVATEQDLQAINTAWQATIRETNAAMAAGFAETNAKFIETNASITETNASITRRMAKHLYITI